tara:strand:+ start:5897 stop:6277 length:381 start_codon:yes stop_codon:yes gene_type:complete
MVNVYECKKMAKELGDNCHNTKNRIIEKMTEANKRDCKKLGNYLQSLMVIESLSSYICVCCCEHETLSPSIISELKNKCKGLVKLSTALIESMNKDICNYIQCNEMITFCEKCINIKKDKSKTKKK